MIVDYEWFTSGTTAPPEILRRGGSRPATKAELLNFFEHLEEELVRNGFLRNRESRPSMVRNLRSLFQRAQCTEQELRTLHGVVTAFAGPRQRKENLAKDSNMPNLTYETALIVGAGSGLSASLARLFSREGLQVALAARNAEKLGALCAETGAKAFGCGSTDPGQVAQMFAAAEAAIGSPAVVVYNA